MGQTAQSGQIVAATQTAFGTPVAPATLASDGISVKILGGSLGGNREMLIGEPEVGGGRDRADAMNAGISYAGEYNMYARFRAVAFFLGNALGVKASVAVSGVTGAYEHTITPADGQIPFMTIHEQIGESLEKFLYTDVIANTFHMECSASELLQCTVGLIAKSGKGGQAAVNGVSLLDNTPLVPGTNIELKYAGEKLPAKSFSLDITNNVEDDNFYMGEFEVGDLTALSREVSGSVNIRHTDAKWMKQALWGSATATEVGGLVTKEPLEVIITAYEDIPGATPATKYSMTLTFPKVAFEPFSFEVQGNSAFENDISMVMLRPDLGEKVMEAVIVNGDADIA